MMFNVPDKLWSPISNLLITTLFKKSKGLKKLRVGYYYILLNIITYENILSLCYLYTSTLFQAFSQKPIRMCKYANQCLF